MKNKLTAIWRILRAGRFAVFTFEDFMGADLFCWNVSENDPIFFWYIRQRLENIQKYHGELDSEWRKLK